MSPCTHESGGFWWPAVLMQAEAARKTSAPVTIYQNRKRWLTRVWFSRS